MNFSMNKAFYAFPSQPEHLSETIIEAINVINKKNYIKIIPWTDLNPTGKIIISQVLNKINQCDLFLYDLSNFNANVCFELGYAISKEKKIWGTLDSSSPSNIKLIKESDVFSIIGYQEHINFEDIIKAFCNDKPFLDLNQSFISQFENFKNFNYNNFENKDILYLKSTLGSTASKKLSHFLINLKREIIEIDILENSYQPFDEIIVNVLRSNVVIVHLLDEKQNNHKEINAIYSLIAGLSVGFNKMTLMVAPEPFQPPLDYRNLLITHRTAKECVEKVEKWIYPILSKGTNNIQHKNKVTQDNELALIRFVLGDGQAEHEEKELQSYFVETSQYHQGLNERIGLFIGRKGTGKTANLFKIREHFSIEKQTFIVTIKPQSFRLETYVKLINEFFNDIDIRSYITEKIWEFIIFSSILFELYEKLKNKPVYYDFSEEENFLIKYVDDNLDIITSDFGDKIDYIYNKANILFNENKNPKTIIEIIFNDYLHNIQHILKINLNNFGRIVILIDNLDKAWDFGKNINLQCIIIYGLIGFYNTLEKRLNWKKGDIRYLIFLREDIYKVVNEKAREQDKLLLNTTRLDWNDKDLLLRVIEERFLYFDQNLKREEIWKNLFCNQINGISTREYLFNNVIKRPRDLIYIVKSAINVSINHRNEKIEKEDIITAQKTYFEFLVSNTVTEYKFFIPEIKSIIYSFYQCPEKINFYFLNKKLKKFITKKINMDELVTFLINISFLGIEINDKYMFSSNEHETEVLFNHYKIEKKRLFKHITFKINEPFYLGLQQ